MATLDIFNDDAFSVSTLSQTITDIPDVPTQLGDKGIFREYGINTTVMMIERQGSSLKLIPAAPRGGVREPVALGPRKLIPLQAIHLPASWSVLADEVQGIRAFGSETEVDAVGKLVARKLAVVRGSMDLTHEYQRVGALKGVVLDADGSTELLDIYQAFGMTQVTQFFNIATPNSGASVKAKILALKKAIKAKLGGRSYTRIRVICSDGFFEHLIEHDSVKSAWDRWQDGAFARQDQTKGDWEFIDVVFEIYSGGTSAGDFIEDGFAYAYPEGVPDMFQSAFAPGDYVETVNTEGLPYYAKQELMKFGKGIEGEAQSNPLHFNSLPECVIRLSAAAS
jgi:hypothetical protein